MLLKKGAVKKRDVGREANYYYNSLLLIIYSNN